jgi:hypothetical protein
VDQPQRQAGEELDGRVHAARLQPAHHRRRDRLRERRVDARRPHHGDGLQHRRDRGAVPGARTARLRRPRQRHPAAEREEELQRGSGAARQK